MASLLPRSMSSAGVAAGVEIVATAIASRNEELISLMAVSLAARDLMDEFTTFTTWRKKVSNMVSCEDGCNIERPCRNLLCSAL